MSRPFEGTFRSLAKVEKHLDYLVNEVTRLQASNRKLSKMNKELWDLVKVQGRYNSEEENTEVQKILNKYESSPSTQQG